MLIHLCTAVMIYIVNNKSVGKALVVLSIGLNIVMLFF